MSFSRLLHTERGRILLVNLSHTVNHDYVPADLLERLLPALHAALQKLQQPFTDEALIRAFATVIWDEQTNYQLAGCEQPAETAQIAAVRTLDELRPLLKRIYKVHRLRQVLSALAPDPPETALIEAAKALNNYAPTMPQLTVGRAFNFFWATSAHEIRSLRSTFGYQGSALAAALRDRLGLVQLKPSAAAGPVHLFLFESQAPLATMSSRKSFRVSRPTTLDGFDNSRFRQHRPPPLDPHGWGATVDLTDGIYGIGLPELVSTEIPMLTEIHCSYVGRVLSDPVGTDLDFIRYLAPDLDLAEVALDLDSQVAA